MHKGCETGPSACSPYPRRHSLKLNQLSQRCAVPLFSMLKQDAKFHPKGTDISSFSLINQDSYDQPNYFVSLRLKWLLVLPCLT